MSWIDKFKDGKILIHQEAYHNKYWSAIFDETNLTVIVKWGRIGTKGSQKTYKFGSTYQAAAFLDTKFNEKKRKGYVDKLNGVSIDGPKLEQLAVEAAIVGTQNKCHEMEWVEIQPHGDCDFTYHKIEQTRLFEPDCVPGLLVAMETKKAYDGSTSFSLLFTGDAAFLVNQSARKTHRRIVKSDPLYELTQKVEEAVGHSLS